MAMTEMTVRKNVQCQEESRHIRLTKSIPWLRIYCLHQRHMTKLGPYYANFIYSYYHMFGLPPV